MILSNKSKTINFIVGVFIGAISSIGILIIIVVHDIENDTKIELNSDAYLAHDDCLIDPQQSMIGVWKGEKYYPELDKLHKWTTSRLSNGTFNIIFETKNGDSVTISKESGLWSYSQCLYSTVIKKRNNENVLFVDIYRVHALSINKMVYTLYRTGDTFTAYPVKNIIHKKLNHISI